MTESAFDEGFLERLMALAAEIENEETDPDDDDEEDFDDDDDERETTQKIAAQIEPLLAQREQAFAAIVQFISDQHGAGPIASLDEDKLRPLVEEAVHADADWSEESEMEATNPQPQTPLQSLLKAHYDLVDLIMSIRDEAQSDDD